MPLGTLASTIFIGMINIYSVAPDNSLTHVYHAEIVDCTVQTECKPFVSLEQCAAAIDLKMIPLLQQYKDTMGVLKFEGTCIQLGEGSTENKKPREIEI